MKPMLSPHVWFFLALAAALSATSLRAAAPRDELFRLVPEDVGLCVLVQDLRSHVDALAGSPFAARVRASFLGAQIGSSPDLRKLGEVEKTLKLHLDIDWQQIRDEILGDAFVFGYRPGPPGHAEQEEGFFLVRARNAALLERLVKRFNEAQKAAGDLKELEERQHKGVKYYRRAERGKPEYYYWMHGPILAASAQESMLQRIIDLDRQAPAADTTVPPVGRTLRDLGIERSLLALWLNPRTFEPDLEQKAKAAKGPEAAFLTNFLVYWKALDGVAVFASPGESLEVGLAVKARTADLPTAARQFLEAAAQPSELWSAFPDGALLALAGRVDLTALVEMTAEFLAPEARKGLRDAFERGWPPLGKLGKDVLPYLGPDIGFCIVAPPAGEKGWAPRVLWALRVQRGNGNVPVDQAILDALNFFSGIAVLDWNSKNRDGLSVKTAMQEKVEVRYFVNEKHFLPGVQPAYAVKAGYLLFASSPDAIQGFRIAPAKEPAAEVPLFRASLLALQTYLTQRREAVLDLFAEKAHVTKEEAAQRLDGVLAGLQFFHSVELTQRVASGQTVLTLRVRTAQPLKK